MSELFSKFVLVAMLSIVGGLCTESLAGSARPQRNYQQSAKQRAQRHRMPSRTVPPQTAPVATNETRPQSSQWEAVEPIEEEWALPIIRDAGGNTSDPSQSKAAVSKTSLQVPPGPSALPGNAEPQPQLIPSDAPMSQEEAPIPTEVPSTEVPVDSAVMSFEPTNCPRCGRNCGANCNPDEDVDWDDTYMIPWEAFAHGEYIGPHRLPHVPEYRLRVDDVIEFVFRLTGVATDGAYRFNVGDQFQVEFLTAERLDRTVVVLPDGFVTLPEIGQVRAAGRTVDEVRDELNERFKKTLTDPNITVTPTTVNTTLSELRATVDSRFGSGGQSRQAKVTPEGTVQLPAIGSVPAQGLTLDELKSEVDARYAEIVPGIEITPILSQRAPRYAFVTGEVAAPGRFTLEGPTTVSQAIAMAGSWNVGADLKNVVVFRRDENWHLVATKLDLKSSLFSPKPCPADEIFLRDSDIVIVPKNHLLKTDNYLQLLFTDAIYRVLPFSASATVNYSRGSSFVP